MNYSLDMNEACLIQQVFIAVGVKKVDRVPLVSDGVWGDQSREAAQKLSLRVGGMNKHHMGKLKGVLTALGLLPDQGENDLARVQQTLVILAAANSEGEGEGEAKTQTGDSSVHLPVELL